MKVNLTVSGPTMAELQREIEKQLGNIDRYVTIGIHEDKSARSGDDSGRTNAEIGAINHFGAEISHPGGTPYGYKSKASANKGDVQFLKKGVGFLEMGVTKAHTITIPARPWLDVGVEQGTAEYVKIIEASAKKGETLDKALEKCGIAAVGFVQKYIKSVSSPANAPSTVNAKGANNPLIDTGQMRQSVTSKVTTVKPKEGLS